MAPNELYFTVLGSSGAGKTTLLACMSKFFREMFSGVYHEGSSDSLVFFADSYKSLEDKANDSENLDLGIAVTNTENFREYSFTLNSKGGKIPVRFADFPGGWLNAPESDEDRKNSAKLAETIGRS